MILEKRAITEPRPANFTARDQCSAVTAQVRTIVAVVSSLALGTVGVAQTGLALNGVPLGNLPIAAAVNPAIKDAGPITTARVSNSLFGITAQDYRINTGPLDTLDGASGAARNWDTFYPGAYRTKINTASGTYRWTALDTFVAKAQRTGKAVYVNIGGTPTWAAPASAQGSDPSGYEGNGSTSPPADLVLDYNNTGYPYSPSFTTWCRDLATRYKGQHIHYEIWNEPNLTQYWSGSMAQLAALARLGYDTIHGADPTAMVTTPSFTTTDGSSNRYLGAYLAAGGATAADEATLHTYIAQNEDYAHPETLATEIDAYRAQYTTYRMGALPFTSTEGNPWSTGDPTKATNDPGVQADDVVKYYFILATHGITTAIWYAADGGRVNRTDTYYHWGRLLNAPTAQDAPPTALNPAGIAWFRVRRLMVGADVTCSVDSNKTYHCTVTRSDTGYHGLVVWNSFGAQPVAVPAYATQSVVVATGVVTPIAPGTATISAGTTPVLLQ